MIVSLVILLVVYDFSFLLVDNTTASYEKEFYITLYVLFLASYVLLKLL